MASVTVSGLADVIQALEEMKTSTQAGVLRRAGIEALQPFDAAWRANAPVRSGHLKAGGGVGTHLTARQASLVRKAGKAFVEVYAGPGPDPQAHLNEFGSRHQPAKPFVRPAWDATQDQVAKNVTEAMTKQVQVTAARLARRAARRRV